MSNEIIKLDRIDVTFTQKNRVIKAVEDVTIHINQGDIYGIVGYSGAGKSTLVRVINLLQKPSGGRITVDGTVLYDKESVQLNAAQLREKRKDIGMIFQHFNLMSQMTAKENVAFALKHSSLSAAEKEEKVRKLLELVGLEDRADNYPSQLSGGQKQRVAIARALANDPKILISDEATSALDTESERLVQVALENMMKNRTSVVIAHRLSTIQNADHIVVMQKGQIVEQGTHMELLQKQGMYKKLVEMQSFE